MAVAGAEASLVLLDEVTYDYEAQPDGSFRVAFNTLYAIENGSIVGKTTLAPQPQSGDMTGPYVYSPDFPTAAQVSTDTATMACAGSIPRSA